MRDKITLTDDGFAFVCCGECGSAESKSRDKSYRCEGCGHTIKPEVEND